ncbi:MAG: adenine deaminase [Bacteroidetes bacterium]|nr:adenine deaminase [Bacteroidota bacterium]
MQEVLPGNIIDVVNKRIFPGEVLVNNGLIESIEEKEVESSIYILPGLVDAHVHIESSMLIPSEFARLAVIHGTVATVSDPHEIANVLGIDGVKYMINNGNKVPFKFYFGAPSCVPATTFETAGAEIGSTGIRELLQMDEIKYLAEMMNFPGVLNADKLVLEKISIAKEYRKVIDGHAPGLRGDEARRYIESGMSTDHECFTREEAQDKLRYGMKISIREGSAAKNFEALISLIEDYPEMIMFCSDDKHPNDLVEGHIDQLVRRALKAGYNEMDVLRSATFNPVKHYELNVGLLQEGDPADLILVDDLQDFSIQACMVSGQWVSRNGKSLIESVSEDVVNNFHCHHISVEQLNMPVSGNSMNVIEVMDGQLITNHLTIQQEQEGSILADPENDILKMVVINRYNNTEPAVAFVKNFGFKHGAIASSVAHDSHNIIAVGVSDEDIVTAVNLLIDNKGGVSLSNRDMKHILPLPVAGLMSTNDAFKVAADYAQIDQLSKELGSTLNAPYMTLSFCALLVIPDLKLSDKGLFSGSSLEFVDLQF